MSEELKNVCDEVAANLVTALSDFENARNHTRKNFEAVKTRIQESLQERVSAQGMTMDISLIRITDRIGNRSLWEWAKNICHIEKPDKQTELLSAFKSKFQATYLELIFKRKT